MLEPEQLYNLFAQQNGESKTCTGWRHCNAMRGASGKRCMQCAWALRRAYTGKAVHSATAACLQLARALFSHVCPTANICDSAVMISVPQSGCSVRSSRALFRVLSVRAASLQRSLPWALGKVIEVPAAKGFVSWVAKAGEFLVLIAILCQRHAAHALPAATSSNPLDAARFWLFRCGVQQGGRSVRLKIFPHQRLASMPQGALRCADQGASGRRIHGG